jgi:hypothetical protein
MSERRIVMMQSGQESSVLYPVTQRVFEFEGKNHNDRFKLICSILEDNNIEYELDMFCNPVYEGKEFWNIYCYGTSDKWLMAHYDTVNQYNANDNTASVINIIDLKRMNPELNIAILDGEEPPYFGEGSRRLCSMFREKDIFPRWILNLELTGYGDKAVIGSMDSSLAEMLVKGMDSGVHRFPFSDSDIVRQCGYTSETIILTMKNMYMENVAYCHNSNDIYQKISILDMIRFTGKLNLLLKTTFI